MADPNPPVDDVAAAVAAEIDRLIKDAAGLPVPKLSGQQLARERQGIDLHADTSAPAILKARGQIEAVRLRLKGMDYRSIARSLGWVHPSNGQPDVKKAHTQVTEALQRWYKEDVTEARTLELERLDAIQERIWKILEVETGKGADDRSLRAIDRFMMVSERRAKLLGLDAPKQTVFKGEVTTEHTGGIEITVEDKASKVERFLKLTDEIVAEEIRRANAIDVESSETTDEVVDVWALDEGDVV